MMFRNRLVYLVYFIADVTVSDIALSLYLQGNVLDVLKKKLINALRKLGRFIFFNVLSFEQVVTVDQQYKRGVYLKFACNFVRWKVICH